MDIKDVEYALSVIKNRSFTIASEELHISQPVLSKYFSNLERLLGLQLAERTSKGLVPTYAGERFYALGMNVADSIRELDTEMKRIASLQKKRLRVGMIRNVQQQFLASTIERFNDLHPDIELNIMQQLSRDIESDVAKGELDIGFISEPSIPGRVGYRALTENYTLLAAPRNMKLSRYAQIVEGLPFPWLNIALLKETRMVLQDESCRFRKFIDEFFVGEGFTPRIGMTTQSTTDALRFTELGVGPCIISDGYLCHISEHERVEVFCIGTPPVTTKFGVIAKDLSLLPPYAEDFINIYMGTHAMQTASSDGGSQHTPPHFIGID